MTTSQNTLDDNPHDKALNTFIPDSLTTLQFLKIKLKKTPDGNPI
jgi:hypothetical protein